MANTKWHSENKYNIAVKSIAFLISPILGMLTALLHPNTKSSYIILFLSFTTLGLTIIVPDDRTDEMNFDSIEYRNQFESMATTSSLDFTSMLDDYSQMSEDGSTDIYSKIIFFFVSRFTGNYHICFMVIAAIYAIFMLKSLRYLVSEQNYALSILCLILLFLFTLCQIQHINAFRFYTAYWVALYAIFKIILDKNYRYLILLAITPTIHGSFFIIYIIYFLYLFAKRYPVHMAIFVIISLLITPISEQLISFGLQFLPGGLSEHYSEYLDFWYIKKINSDGIGYKWVVRLMEFAVRLSVNIMGLFFAYHYKSHIADTKAKHVYYFLLAVLAFVNFTFMIPDMGSRYVMFIFPLIAYIWLVCFATERRWNWLIYSFAGLYLFFFLILPWNIYQIPCLRYYRMLWNADILYQSPIFLWIKYIFLL